MRRLPIRSSNRALAGIITLAASFAGPDSSALATTPTELIVADFNSGTKPNNLGGDFGAWTKDPGDPMQGCIEAFDPANHYGKSGFGLRLIYSVESKNPAFGGLWMRLQDLDASKFGSLAFRVKGDARMGFTTVFKVELKDSLDQSGHFYVRGVTDQWKDVVIPLKDLEGMTNFRRLKELVITFEDSTATAKRGVIYIDDVRFQAAP